MQKSEKFAAKFKKKLSFFWECNIRPAFWCKLKKKFVKFRSKFVAFFPF